MEVLQGPHRAELPHAVNRAEEVSGTEAFFFILDQKHYRKLLTLQTKLAELSAESSIDFFLKFLNLQHNLTVTRGQIACITLDKDLTFVENFSYKNKIVLRDRERWLLNLEKSVSPTIEKKLYPEHWKS